MGIRAALADVRERAASWRHGRSPTGVALPPVRYRMGGHNFADDAAFVDGGCRDARRLVDLAGLTTLSQVLDFGCGSARLAIGILEDVGPIQRYVGVDVQQDLIHWCRRHVTTPGFTFVADNAQNDRYNPSGVGRPTIGAEPAFDIAYAYSVFSHMRNDDVRAYLSEFARLLCPDGVAFFTAFVEDDCEPEAVNPAGYGPLRWSGPLHCVRYNRRTFDQMVTEAGFTIRHFDHHSDTDGQSVYIAESAPT